MGRVGGGGENEDTAVGGGRLCGTSGDGRGGVYSPFATVLANWSLFASLLFSVCRVKQCVSVELICVIVVVQSPPEVCYLSYLLQWCMVQKL